MNCPICKGKMQRKKEQYNYGDMDFGSFDADVCTKCGEVFFTEKSSDAIDAKAKKLGIWGLEKETKISYSGNSLIIRIPKAIADFMGLAKGEEVSLRPEGKRKLVVEVGA